MSFDPARRMFLKKAAITTAVAPAAIAEQISKIQATAGGGGMPYATMGGLMPSPNSAARSGSTAWEDDPYIQRIKALSEMASAGTLPDWKIDEMREEAKWQARARLDPDLVVIRAMSLSARLAVQTERNLAKLIKDQKECFGANVSRNKFFESISSKFGIKFE